MFYFLCVQVYAIKMTHKSLFKVVFAYSILTAVNATAMGIKRQLQTCIYLQPVQISLPYRDKPFQTSNTYHPI